MSAPVLESSEVEVQVLVQPVDAEYHFRHSCALTECYAGFLKPDGGEGGVGASGGKNTAQKPPQLAPETESDGGGNGTTDALAFMALEWQRQPFLKAAGGPLEWIRLAGDGHVQKGVQCAQECKPAREVCGWTIRPRLKRIHSFIQNEGEKPGNEGSLDISTGDDGLGRKPRFPVGEPTLEWKAVQGATWERVIPAQMPLWGGIRHRNSVPNAAFVARTVQALPQNATMCVVFNLGGQIHNHKSEPAIRFEWGNEFSFVLRGMDSAARPCLEKRTTTADGKKEWEVWRRLDDAAPLDENFWSARHALRLYRLSGKLIVEWDGKAWWLVELPANTRKENRETPRPLPVDWASAPLKLSVYGVDCILQFGSLDFNRQAWFTREAPVESGPLNNGRFLLTGAGSQALEIGGASKPGRGRLHGVGLQHIAVNGEWSLAGTNGRVTYSVALSGNDLQVPLLCSMGVQLPPTAANDLPAALDLRPALASLSISSGEPGAMPSAEARLDVEQSILDRFYPDWRSVLAPFRPVEIKARETPSAPWHTLFKGYLLPDAVGQDAFNSHQLSFVARDPMLRLQAPAALVDSRYTALDLFQSNETGVLYGAQGVQHLLEIELGGNEANAINGNGDPFRYLPDGHYPLLDITGIDVFTVQDMPLSGGFRLPPPFGEDLKRWIDTIAEYDHATWYYDPTEGAFVYGHLRQLFAERGAKVWHLRGATTENPEGDDSDEAWPLLSQYGRTGWLDHAYTGTQVWGMALQGGEAFMPSLIVGKFQPNATLNNTDPLSETQSWRRTMLLKQEFIGKMAMQDYADDQARRMWDEFGGKTPHRFDFTIPDGSALRARWGEMAQWRGENLRVVRVEHAFSFGQESERLVTTLTARSLSGTGL